MSHVKGVDRCRRECVGDLSNLDGTEASGRSSPRPPVSDHVDCWSERSCMTQGHRRQA